MKKILALFFAVLYMTTSSGIVLNVHYCMDRVSSVKVDNFNDAFCKCGKNEKSGSCCKTELKVLKGSNAHEATLAYVACKLPPALLTRPVSFKDTFVPAAMAAVLPAGYEPPGLATKTYLENCVFKV